MSRPDYFDWGKELSSLLKVKRYDVVVALFGTNDGQALYDNKKYVRYGTTDWLERYRHRVESMVEMVCAEPTRQLVWLGLPHMRNEKLNRRVHQINEIFASVIAKSQCGQFVPLAPWVSPGDNYSAYIKINGRRAGVRTNDGIHLTFKGGDYVARRLIESRFAFKKKATDDDFGFKPSTGPKVAIHLDGSP